VASRLYRMAVTGPRVTYRRYRRFGISGWAFQLAKPPSQLLSLLKVYWKLPMTPALAEG